MLMSVEVHIEKVAACLLNYDDDESNVRDLLADILHYCDKHSIDFTNELRIASDNYQAEIEQ